MPINGFYREVTTWVALPCGVVTNEAAPRLSVFISPRMEYVPPPTDTDIPLPHLIIKPPQDRLGAYRDWPKVLSGLTFDIHVDDTVYAGQRPVPQWDPALWPDFVRDVPPSVRYLETRKRLTIQTLRSLELADLIQRTYVEHIATTTPVAEPEAVRALRDLFIAPPGPAQTVSPRVSGAVRDFFDFHDQARPLAEAAPAVKEPQTISGTKFTLPKPKTGGRAEYILENTSGSPAEIDFNGGLPKEFADLLSPLPRVKPHSKLRLRLEDGKYKVIDDDEPKKLDFSELLTSASAYPPLLRKLGLVLDFDLPIPFASLAMNGKVRVVPSARTSGIGGYRLQDVTPWTAYLTSAADQHRLFVPAPKRRTHIGGLLRNAGAYRHRMLQVDVEGAMLKLAAAAAEMIENPSSSRLPALRTSGLALVDEQRDQELTATVVSSEAHIGTAAEGGQPLLHAEDVTVGYRIDVRRSDDEDWASLCQRDVRYTISRSSASQLVLPHSFKARDEGYVAPVGETSSGRSDTALRVSSALFRWDGWSLAVPRPGKPVDDRSAVETALSYVRERSLSPLSTDVAPVAGSLPRLRFGRGYSFRARTVDAAGNSITADAATRVNWRTAETSFEAEPFLRFEPVDAPLLVPLAQPSRGETASRIVIRTAEGKSATSSEWMVVPPKTSQWLAELHGVFDHLSAEAAWKLITSLDGDPPEGVHAPAWLKRVGDGNNGMPYLADPMCKGAAVCTGKSILRVAFTDRKGAVRAEQFRPFRLRVSGGNGEARIAGKLLQINIPPGRWQTIRVSSFLHDGDERTFKFRAWLDERFDQELLARVCHGQLGALTPEREIKIVHAVQRPLPPDAEGDVRFTSLDAAQQMRSPLVRFAAMVAIDVPSTGKVDFHAVWREKVDQGSGSSWVETAGAAHIREIAVPAPQDAAGAFDQATVADECTLNLHCTPRFSFDAVHRFPDTHHRLVSFQADASTRFAEYFPAETTGIARDGTPQSIHILNSAPPAEPDVLYIVPTFRSEQESLEAQRVRRTRWGGGLRIYMRRGWFSSGDDEMLAVAVPPANAAPLREGEAAPPVSRWAADPIWKADAIESPITLAHLPIISARHNERPATERMASTTKENSIHHPGLRIPLKTPSANATSALVDIAAYPVFLDPAKDLLYCDIELRGTTAYFPFVRLSLARYQPFSLEGAHLSPAIEAAFVQIAPDRVVTIRRESASSVFVSVNGPAFEEGPPYDDGRPTSPPAQIEVSIERPALGSSDAGWVPLASVPTLLPGIRDASVPSRGRSIDIPPAAKGGRLVIREYEFLYGDDPADPSKPAEIKRLVFADAIPLDLV